MADPDTPVRIAAVGDIHVDPSRVEEVREGFADLADAADLLLVAGDLTTLGEPEQGAAAAEALRDVGVPVLAVLGNHDHHDARADELVAELAAGGVQVLQGEHTTVRVGDVDVGVVGAKGFVGGFAGSHLPDFGEPSLRGIYRETSGEVAALDRGLKAIALAPVRIALLHYAPTSETLVGEPEGIWTMLGSDRLAAPVVEHEPDLVLHGHAHAGSPDGAIGATPVHNVAAPLLRAPYRVFELRAAPGPGAVH